MNWNLIWPPFVFGLIWGAYFAHLFYSNKIKKLKEEFSKNIPLPEIPSPHVERHLVPMRVKKWVYVSSLLFKQEMGYDYAIKALTKDLIDEFIKKGYIKFAKEEVDDMQCRVSAELSIVVDESSKE